MQSYEIMELAIKGDTYKIIELCKRDILEKSIKTMYGNATLVRTKAAQRFLAKVDSGDIVRYGANIQEIDGVKHQVFTNGFIVMALKQPLEGLNEQSGPIPIDYNYLFYMLDRIETNINLADVKETILRNKIAYMENKRDKGNKLILKDATFDVENVRYNAQFILDCYKILGGDIKFYQDNNKNTSHAILESDNGFACIFPIRKK